MLLQFKVVQDGSYWIADTRELKWAKVSAPASDPASVVVETGKLIPQGFGVFLMDGRVNAGEKPDRKVEGPTSIGVNTIGLGDTILIAIRVDVEVSDFTMPVPIRQVLYKIMPSDPKQVESLLTESFDGNRDADRDSNPAGDPGGDTTGSAGQQSPEAA